MPVGAGAGIHWQVAQATSLQNIVFNMRTDGGDANAQQVRKSGYNVLQILGH
jgi:glucan 1,3-beta-glucosidase